MTLKRIPMAIMQYFSKQLREKKTVDPNNGQEALTETYNLKPEFLSIPSTKYSHQRKWSETLSHIYHEDNIFPDHFSDDTESKKTVSNSNIDRSSNSPRRWTQIVSLLPVYLLQISYGMNSGYPAIVTPQLDEPCSKFNITLDQESWIVCLDNTATPIVCILSGFFQQRYGPLRVLEFACVPYTFAWLVAALSTSAAHLYISRILVGISHALLATTVYTVEVASKEMRGTFSVMEAVLRCTGCLMVYSLGYFLRWDEIAFIGLGVPVIALVVALMSATESPVFLVAQNKIEEAKVALTRLYGPCYKVPEEVEIIRQNLKRRIEASGTTGHQGWGSSMATNMKRFKTSPEVYKPFFIIIFLIFIQQFSGMSILRAYVVKIFDDIFTNDKRNQTSLIGSMFRSNLTNNTNLFNDSIPNEISNCDSGVRTSNNAYLSAIVIGVVRTVSSLLLSQLLRNYRRRFMYFVSAIATIFSLVSFATCDLLIENDFMFDGDDKIRAILKWVSLLTACCLVFAVQLGIQTLPFLLSGELFPSDIRAFCKGITRSFACILLIGGLKMFPTLENTIGIHGTFYSFSAVMILCTPVIYCVVPETKDMSLEMVENYFLPNRTRFYVDLISLRSLRGSICSTTSERTIAPNAEGQSQIFQDASKRYSDNQSPESGIFNSHSENNSSEDICKTESSRYSSSHSPLGDRLTSPDLYSITSSNTSSLNSASSHQCKEQDLKNGTRF